MIGIYQITSPEGKDFKHSQESIGKIREAMTGRKRVFSESHKQALQEAAKRRHRVSKDAA